MSTNAKSSTHGRPRALLLAYHYDRAKTMESRLSWRRAQHAAAEYDATVICAYQEDERGDFLAEKTNCQDEHPVEVIAIAHNRLEKAAKRLPGGFYLAYRLWHRRVLQRVRQLHRERPFALVHHVSFCGYREPSDCWRLGVPFVWGPIGGTHNYPWRYLGQLHFAGAMRETARNALNSWQRKHSRLVKQALQAADGVAVASEAAGKELASLGDRPLQVLLETGVDAAPSKKRRRAASEPLRILWSGRLECWKALPLLLRAMAELPSSCAVELRVLGEGPCRERWRRLATRLDIAESVEWAGWPTYLQQLPHYHWADVFAFTSLRDTSGTGLLEALTAGTPIIGVDHQGAADVMSEDSAVRVPVTTPSATIVGFRDALMQLTADRALLESLSDGARARSAEFTWDRQQAAMRRVYQSVLPAAETSESPRHVPSRQEETPAYARHPEEAMQAVLLGVKSASV